ncbi:MAG: VCBS repeat-containing protein, partial [Planctomycetes bacterium]|nr:VCBS repeat-containing protein [Planctomycetota bacterium]
QVAGCYGAFGIALSDHDGDGYDDYAIAAPNASVPAGSVGPGVVYLHSGRTGEIFRDYVGELSGTRFGEAMCDPGDVDGDSHPDLIVSARDFDSGGPNTGRVYAFSGFDGSILWTTDGVEATGTLGSALAAVADFDGDGAADVVAGQPGYGVGLAGRGRVVLLSGRTGAVLGNADGPVAYSSVGTAFAARAGSIYVSDVLGRVYSVGAPALGILPLTLAYDRPAGADGTAQMAFVTAPGGAQRLLIGRPRVDSNGLANNGRVELFQGLTSVLSIDGTFAQAQLGIHVACGRDIDGDGDEDLVFAGYSGGPFVPDPVTVMRQDGTVVETVTMASANRAILLSIGDTSGDGRGEWLQAIVSGVHGLSECQMFCRGLDEPVVSQPGGGTTVDYTFDLTPLRAGAIYWTLFSLSGSDPGLVIDPSWPRLPLNIDGMTNLFFIQANGPVLPGTIGNLDAAGTGSCAVALPTNLAPLASGWQLSAVTVAFGPGGWPPVAVTNPRKVTLP